MKSKTFTTALLFLLALCSAAQAGSLIPLGADEWYTTVAENHKPTMVLVTGKKCDRCEEMKKLIEQASELREDVTFYIMTDEQLPIADQLLPYVMFNVPGGKSIIRGHGFKPETVQDVMIFISQRESYAAREEALEAALRGHTNKKKILEADNASSDEVAKLVREIDLLSTRLTALRSNNKLNAFGKN